MEPCYIIEVQSHKLNLRKKRPEVLGTYMHVGYMCIIFSTEKKARKYIQSLSPVINVDEHGYSSLHRDFERRYVIRKTIGGEAMTLPPMNPAHSPQVPQHTVGEGTTLAIFNPEYAGVNNKRQF